MELYRTVLADPPWPYNSPRAIVGNAGRGSQNGKAAHMTQVSVADHYNTMTLDDIAALPIDAITEQDSHLYLWTTNGFMVEAHDIARKWGFEPKTIITWVKVKQDDSCCPSMKTGWWYRGATEHMVFAVKGKQRLVGPPAPTAYLQPRLRHSEKPVFFHDLIEKQSPGPYLELFARRARSGWSVWGNEAPNPIILPQAEIS